MNLKSTTLITFSIIATILIHANASTYSNRIMLNTDGLTMTNEESQALDFMYEYMNAADAIDHPASFYLENIRMSMKARKEMPWGHTIPDILFRHFVLPVRVNNENLDSTRIKLYDELKSRVAGMTMTEAAIEVNHWCHERVTYEPSDARTSSPLATIKTAKGRCGEESTLTVAVLRTIGIPARQVYTPRWAHTDDNHAWVEVWTDGKWHFMGACEPEPVLDLGWFNAPASRAMLMHTRVFGHYEGPEEKVLETKNFTEINLIGNYADTARVDFTVKNMNGKPVDKATVKFMIYNYAEFCPVVTKYTDVNGRTSLTAGLGDMMVWAEKNGRYGYALATFGKNKSVTLSLNKCQSSDEAQRVMKAEYYDIIPPKEKSRIPHIDEKTKRQNEWRLAQEDSIRGLYESTFINRDSAKVIAEKLGIGTDDVASIIVKSRGNHRVIVDFLKSKSDKTRAVELLKTLSDKDLRDVGTDVLEDGYNARNAMIQERVDDEMLTPYKQMFANQVDAKAAAIFKSKPEMLVKWCHDSLTLIDDMNTSHIIISPKGVWTTRCTDKRSREIFFVCIARSLGIDARKDVVTGKTQYRNNGAQWIDVNFDAEIQKSAPKGKLVITYEPTKLLPDPNYYSQFTISKIQNGLPQLLSFDEGQVDMGGGVSWNNTFHKGTNIDIGTYMITYGTRLANGSVLAKAQTFNVMTNKTTEIKLKMRKSKNDIEVIGEFNSESKYKDIASNEIRTILSTTGRGYFCVGIIGMGQEPTNHAIRDIVAAKTELESWGRPILILFTSKEDENKFKAAEFGTLPKTVVFGIDEDGSIRKQIAKNMHYNEDAPLPYFIITDTFNRVVFEQQGYTIGLGAKIANTGRQL